MVRGSVEVDKSGQRWARIEIEDSGRGIQHGDLPFVFIPFFTTKREGHGIGLALAHRIVSQHGGTLKAGNSVHGGAVFTLKLRAQAEKLNS
jgi:signal transduction histidine kinase